MFQTIQSMGNHMLIDIMEVKISEDIVKTVRAYLIRIPMSERGRFLAAASKLRCAGNILAWIPGILDDIDRISRAKENGRTYKEQLDKELDETQYLDTPFGIIPNPCYKGPLML